MAAAYSLDEIFKVLCAIYLTLLTLEGGRIWDVSAGGGVYMRCQCLWEGGVDMGC